jgi:hypothetical protein
LLLFGGEDSVSDDAGRMLEAAFRLVDDLLDDLLDVLLAGRLEVGRADLVVPPLALEVVVLAAVDLVVPDRVVPDLVVPDLEAVDLVVEGDVFLAVPLVLDVRLAPVDDLVVDRDDDVLALVVPLERVALGVPTFIADIVLAAALRAFAAVDIDLVAVFIARIAVDMVFADAVALVAAAVILLAAEFTLVAADDTPRAAVAGVVVLRDELRVDRDEVDRDADGRVAADRVVPRDDAARDDVERVLLRDDRDALLRLAVDPLRAGRALAVRDVLVLLAVLVRGRLAVPPDALRLADLLRAVLAELRRVAARDVV